MKPITVDNLIAALTDLKRDAFVRMSSDAEGNVIRDFSWIEVGPGEIILYPVD